MTNKLFANLRLLRPDINLEVGSGSRAKPTAEVMRCFEQVTDDRAPSYASVVGDASAKLAGRGKQGRVPELWNGRTAERIGNDLAAQLIQMHQAQAAV